MKKSIFLILTLAMTSTGLLGASGEDDKEMMLTQGKPSAQEEKKPPLNDYTPDGQRAFENEQGIRLPSIAFFEKGEKKLCFYGVRHSCGKDHPTFQRTDQLFKEYQPDAVIIEGFPPGEEKAITDHCIAILKEDEEYWSQIGENTYTAMKATEARITFRTGEPTQDSITAHFKEQGYTDDDITFYRFVQRTANTHHDIGCKMLQDWLRYSGLAHREDEFCRWHQEKMNQPVRLEDLTDSEFVAPVRQGHFIGQMSQAMDDCRNNNILRITDQLMGEYQRVLVVYGGSHYFQQYPVLRQRYGDPTYSKDSQVGCMGRLLSCLCCC